MLVFNKKKSGSLNSETGSFSSGSGRLNSEPGGLRSGSGKAVIVISMGIILFMFSSMLPVGCGKKGDPLPPEKLMPSPPVNLSHALEGDNLILSWDNRDSGKNIGGIELFIFLRKTLNTPDSDLCLTCPMEFELVATLDSSASQYSETIKSGFVYFYKLRSYTKDNLYSDYSKIIEFEY